MLPERIRTARLVLRPPVLTDAAAIFHGYARDPDVTRYLTFRPNRDLAETEGFVRGRIEDWAGDTRRPWALSLIDRGDSVIGMVELRLSPPRAELGYVLAKVHWGRGLMTEAALAVTSLGLAEADIYRVAAVCDVDNVGSARVLEKIGMQREGALRRYMVHPNVSDEPRDVYLYAKVR